MSPIVAGESYGYYGVAGNDALDPALLVLVGDVGLIIYSIRTEEDDTGLEYFVFSQAPRFTYYRLNCVDFGNGVFVTGGGGGVLASSGDGSNWTTLTSGTTRSINDVCHVSDSIWVAVGDAGTLLLSTDNGITWASGSYGAAGLYGVASNGTNVVAVGGAGTVYVSTDSGTTWTAATSGSLEDLHDVVWCGDLGLWIIVGKNSTVLSYDGAVPGVFDAGSVDVEVDLEGVAWAGAGGLLIAAGSGAVTVTSTDGISWVQQESGATSTFFHAVEYIDTRFIAVGAEQKIAYSATGAGVRSFDLFKPISDTYRAVAMARFGGTILYLGMREFEDGAWVYWPRRIRNPAPGTINDFDEAFGAYFSDLPGDGAIIAAASIEGGIVVGEQNQIALLTDGGSAVTPWDYHDNYGEGLQLISNLTTFGGAAYGICTDGLIYRADYNSVQRLQSFFDLTKFDDFNPGSERVSIQFDPATQKLIVFRPASPWTLFLCDDENGGVTEFNLPEFQDGGVTYTPLSLLVVQGEIDGVKVGYGTDYEPMEEVITLDLQMASGITGFDGADGLTEIPFAGDMITGCFRMTQLGKRGEIREILVRTTCDPDATIRPRVAIGVKSEPEDDWRYSPPTAGTIAADGSTGILEGTGTAFSNKIAEADGVTLAYDIPWLVEKITHVYTKHTITNVKTTAAYTKTGARQITLAAVIPANQELFVHARGLPYVRGEEGDLVELTNGQIHVIDEIVSATEAICSSLPPDYDGAATYIPAQEMPAGDSYGSGKLTFGLGQGFDQVMLRFIMVAGIEGDAKYAKINRIEVGYEPTGPELKTDD
jgi:photosystem II stability/assembly factor-like uncharacterized protein